MIERLEPVLRAERPDLVLVPGDVNSTLAAALCAAAAAASRSATSSPGCAASTARCPRRSTGSSPTTSPSCSSLHSPEAEDNLRAEGVDVGERCSFVGNTMIDTLVALEDRLPRARRGARRSGSSPGSYLLVTLHRPALVDGPLLADAIAALGAVAARAAGAVPGPPADPQDARPARAAGACALVDPVGYLDFLSLEADAAAVLTDSGGIQEETTYLGVPCFTLRDNTERPVTVRAGTNTLLGLAPERIARDPGAARGGAREARRNLRRNGTARRRERVADVLADW